MGFFDLSIPYLEASPSSKLASHNPSQKPTRLKLVIKAMEFGYTGVAYNRTIKGVMSDADCCSISLHSFSSLLKLKPSLSASVKLHRDLLGLPMCSPFRQYTRLTVLVDSSAQAASLNSGNPILKTYDLVAVRPLNQNTFEQACQSAEVDIIAIDFSEKLPFRLKLPLVKRAIQRGIYFEIAYSNLIDVRTRSQMISNAKLLVDWTRGKNLIFSSAAPTVNELRGPYDVTNLASLLGMSMERAKAAVSKNCRTLLENALRKKKFYKEAIRIEAVSSGNQFGDWLKWDPISSGDGDLLLDDLGKSFSASSKVCKTSKAIDFSSIVDASHGFQVKDLISGSQATNQNSLSSAEIIDTSTMTKVVSKQLETNQCSLNNTPSICQTSSCEDSRKSFSPDASPKVFSNAEEARIHTTTSEEEANDSVALDEYLTPMDTEAHALQLKNCISICEQNFELPDENLTKANNVEFDASTPFEAFQNEETEKSKSFDAVLSAQNVALDEVSSEMGINNESDLLLARSHLLEREEIREFREDDVLLADGNPCVESYDEEKSKDDSPVANEPNEVTMEDQKEGDAHAEVLFADGKLYGKSCDEVKGEAGFSAANYEQINEVTMIDQEGGEAHLKVVLADGKPYVESYDEVKGKDDSPVANHEQLNEVIMEDQKQGEAHTETNYSTWDESMQGKNRVKQRRRHPPLLFPFKRALNPLFFKKKAQKFKKKIKVL